MKRRKHAIRVMLLLVVSLSFAGCGGIDKTVGYDPGNKKGVVPLLQIPFFSMLLSVLGDSEAAKADFVVVPVYFGTNRTTNLAARGFDRFEDGRGEMIYGRCDITVPHNRHRPGEIERPLFRFIKEDPSKHFTLQGEPSLLEKEKFYAELADRVRQSKGTKALVFIHGFRVSFADAGFRTAQLARDLNFDGPPIFFSWPASSGVLKYLADYEAIKWAKPHIERFLADIAIQTRAENIYLIAHSMGNEGLTEAFIEMVRNNPQVKSQFKEVILAAPDIDAKTFRDNIAPALAATGAGITLYASSNDEAMKASRVIRANSPRAGDAMNLVVVNGIETVDASAVQTDFGFKHSYFAEADSILQDIYYLIHAKLRAPERFGLEPVSTPEGTYWKLLPRKSYLLWTLFVVLPILLVAVALTLWLRRRKRRSR